MNQFGLIGYPLDHSWSVQYFSNKFIELKLIDHEYRLFPIHTPDELPALVTGNPGLRGLNVTLPFKVSILSFLDGISPDAREVGAVNCIKIIRDTGKNSLLGYNTDVYGFGETLKPLLKPHHLKALVLGTGGASRAVVHVLKSLGVGYALVSRKPDAKGILAYEDLTMQILKGHTIIINTTPAGMYPDVSSYPEIPYQFLDRGHLLYDLVYNPETTLFLRKGQEAGAETINGLKMLELQAERSWEIWTNP